MLRAGLMPRQTSGLNCPYVWDQVGALACRLPFINRSLVRLKELVNKMKGRKKVKTLKWQIKAGVEAEAREILSTRSTPPGRFLDLAVARGRDLEPLGRLAG